MAQNPTNKHSLKTLANLLLSRMENRKYLLFNPKDRSVIQAELLEFLPNFLLSEEALNEEVRGAVTSRSGEISDANFSETEAYQSQKRALKSKYSDNAIAGFYLKTSLRQACKEIADFLFDNSHVEDVFESDEVLQKLVQETITNFDESQIA